MRGQQRSFLTEQIGHVDLVKVILFNWVEFF